MLAAFLFLAGIACDRPKPALFEDDFSDPGSGWAAASATPAPSEQTGATYRNGGLVISVKGPQGAQSTGENIAALSAASNVSVRVDVAFQQASEVAFAALVCRAKQDRRYTFSIENDGAFGIYKRVGEQTKALEFGRSDDLRKRGGKHRLRADCAGDRLALYANGRLLAETYDSELSDGAIGMRAGVGGRGASRPEAEATVRFDNLEVHRATARKEGAAKSLPAPGRELFEDDFSDPTSGWLSAAQPSATPGAAYESGRLVFRVATAGGAAFVDSAGVDPAIESLEDVSIEAEMSLLRWSDPGSVAFSGVSCRSDGLKGYTFLLYGDGSFSIVKLSPQGEGAEFLAGGSDRVVKAGPGQVNRIRADCHGEELSLEVNGKALVTARDAAYTRGRLGLIAGTDGEPPVEAAFENLVVRRP